MIEGYSKVDLEEMAKECQRKYDKLFKQTLRKPMLGEIGTNTQMVEALKDLNFDYKQEMRDYTDEFLDDLDGGFIDIFLNAEKEGKNVITQAQESLECLEAAERAFNREMYVDEDSKPCDEYGTRLSYDLEHRVFEVIRCTEDPD